MYAIICSAEKFHKHTRGFQNFIQGDQSIPRFAFPWIPFLALFNNWWLFFKRGTKGNFSHFSFGPPFEFFWRIFTKFLCGVYTGCFFISSSLFWLDLFIFPLVLDDFFTTQTRNRGSRWFVQKHFLNVLKYLLKQLKNCHFSIFV